jgi:hypothetical protein
LDRLWINFVPLKSNLHKRFALQNKWRKEPFAADPFSFDVQRPQKRKTDRKKAQILFVVLNLITPS